MLAREIQVLQRTQPFTGLRIHVSDGTTYDVTHPEMMLVTAAVVHLALPPLENGLPTESVYIDPIHVTRIEPLNGKRTARKPRKSK